MKEPNEETINLERLMNDDSYNIFKELNFPNLKRRRLYAKESLIEPTTKQTVAALFLASLMTPIQTNRIQEYILGPVIGYGGFSVVHRAHHLNHVRAVKVIDTHFMSPGDLVRFKRELTIWRSLCHPRIVNLQRVIQRSKQYYLVCDYCLQGTLTAPLPEIDAKRIFRELCQAVHYLHIDRRVSHKDLKLENVLLDEHGQVKLCDFGLAVYHRSKRSEPTAGSLPYMAPEQLKSPVHLACPKTDIWSLGILLYTLLVGHFPFMDNFDLRLIQKIQEAEVSFPSHMPEDVSCLIRDCLQRDPQRRPSIDQVLKYAWLQS